MEEIILDHSDWKSPEKVSFYKIATEPSYVIWWKVFNLFISLILYDDFWRGKFK